MPQRDDVLTPPEFAKAIGVEEKTLEKWSDLPWSVVTGRTRYMRWENWLRYLDARTPQLAAIRKAS